MHRLIEKFRTIGGPKDPNIYRYKGFNIPLNLMFLTGGGPDTFDLISKAHINNLEKLAGLKPDFSVLEVGCGIGRDAIPLTKRLSRKGNYLGVDIIGPSIEWCNKNIGAKHSNFKFVHFDIKDQLHNPSGTITTQDVHIPLKPGSVDLILLQSVFTHLLRADIVHYLHEFRQLLKPTGRVYATMFIVDEKVLAAARASDLTPWKLTFEHEIGDGCRINDPLHPTGAVAYTVDALDQMLREAGLKLERELLRGAWSGYYSNTYDGQDVAILALANNPTHQTNQP